MKVKERKERNKQKKDDQVRKRTIQMYVVPYVQQGASQ